MANIQELMTALILAPRETERSRFRATITPNRGNQRFLTLIAHDAGEARQTLVKAAKREFPHGFTFSVRPE